MNRINIKSLKVLQASASLMIIFAFIPFLNPFRFGEAGNVPLVAMLWNTGEVGSYFAGQNINAMSLNSTLFGYVLALIVSLLFVLMTTILTIKLNDSSRLAIKIGFFFGIVLSVAYFSLFLDFSDLNTQILSAHSGEIGRKIQIFTRIPIGIYLYIILSFVYTISAYLSYNFDLGAIWFTIQSNFSNQFKGGIQPPYNKVTRKMPVEMVQPAKRMIYPLTQHIGSSCQPLVKVGDDVCIGQKIADDQNMICAPIHSTVSGKVVEIAFHSHTTEKVAQAIVIKNDFKDRMHESLINVHWDYQQMSPEEIISCIREAGVVGMGGSAFPTHAKIQNAMKKIDTIVINAAESEPYLSGDHRLLLENTAEFVEGIKILRHVLGVRRVYIGIESNKADAISLLYKVLRKTHIRVVVLATKYPQGGERQLIKAVTGREVLSGKLPIDVGCCVFNVDTAIAVYRGVVKGYPLMRRIVTVAGDAMERCGNANVRIGTPILHVLEHFGFDETKLSKLIVGGPMMGNAIDRLDAPVIKNTVGLLGFTEEQQVEDCDENACIRCGRCITVCPMRLAPNYIRLYSRAEQIEKCKEIGALDCIECGCCSYTCPAKLPLLHHIRVAKQKIKESSKSEA